MFYSHSCNWVLPVSEFSFQKELKVENASTKGHNASSKLEVDTVTGTLGASYASESKNKEERYCTGLDDCSL